MKLSKKQYGLIKELYEMDEEADESGDPYEAYYDVEKDTSFYSKHVKPLVESEMVKVVEDRRDVVVIAAEYRNSPPAVKAYEAKPKAKKKAKPKANGRSLSQQIRDVYDC